MSNDSSGRPTLIVERYGSRNWAVLDRKGELIVVAVYLKGAEAVRAHITALEAQVNKLTDQLMQA